MKETSTTQFATFHLAELYMGIEVTRVQEVIRAQPTTRAPLAPDVVEGLINLRGQIVTALDMRRRAGLPPREDGRRMNIVMRTEEGPVSLLVDEIGDVVEVGSGCHEPIPEGLHGEIRQLVDGVYKLPDRLMLSLNPEKVLALPGAA